MAMLNRESTTQLSFEFLSLIVSELGERKFAYVDRASEIPRNAEYLSAVIKAGDAPRVLPEVAHEFASKIKPELARCYKLDRPQDVEDYYVAYDPASGVSIRCFRVWHIIQGDVVFRFDSVFS